MCGICGFVGRRPVADGGAVVAAMADAIRHRGPDGGGRREISSRGEREALSGWLGHRRLKIIDLSELAEQPMVSPDGAAMLTFNGEVYNFRELRRELEAHGHRLRSSGDTEVVLHAYLEWGADFVSRLDGMFALAIWDAVHGRLLLARDRTGKKPLFWCEREGRFAFGSEIKALLAAPWVTPSPDLRRLPELLMNGFVSGEGTLYEGVHQVPPASVLSFDAGGVHGPRRYWEPPRPDGSQAPSRERPEAIAELLRAAVQRRLVSDVPLGALLSGGIDSSLVVGLMARLREDPVSTFSAGFPEEPSFDERAYARRIAERFGTSHTEFTVEADAVALMDRLLWHHDQPYADYSAIPTYLLCRLAREHVTVVLNGDGGDEVFAGYDRFRAAWLAQRIPSGVVRLAAPLVSLLPRSSGYYGLRRRAQRFVADCHLPLTDRYASWVGVFDRALLEDLIGAEADGIDAAGGPLRSRLDADSGLDPLDRILDANFRTYLPDDLAVKMDRMSMAHSLETRSPFLDTALLEYVAGIPARDKIGRRQVKPLLREALGPLLPTEIWERRKHGFAVPMGKWFRGQLRPMFEDEVLAADARTAALLDRATLHRMWGQHQAGELDHGLRLWTVATLERWLRTLESSTPMAPPDTAIAGADAI